MAFGRMGRGVGGFGQASLAALALLSLAACGETRMSDGPSEESITSSTAVSVASSESSVPASTSIRPTDRTEVVEVSTLGATRLPPVGSNGNCGNRPAGSSSPVFAANGTFAVYLLDADAESRIARFDVVQWLSGEDARQASLRDHPDDLDGPSNDYYLINDSDFVRTATVRPDATVMLTHVREGHSADVDPDLLVRLPDYVAEGSSEDVYWLTFDGGEITAICEQYRP